LNIPQLVKIVYPDIVGRNWFTVRVVDFLKDGSQSGSNIININIEQQSQYNSFDNIFSNVDGRTLLPRSVNFEVNKHEGCPEELLEPIGKRRLQYRGIRGGVYLLNVTLPELDVLFPLLCVLLLQVFHKVVCAKFRSCPLLVVGSALSPLPLIAATINHFIDCVNIVGVNRRSDIIVVRLPLLCCTVACINTFLTPKRYTKTT
jgi:hypothetical protein